MPNTIKSQDILEPYREKLDQVQTRTTCRCGATLPRNIEGYPHEDGWDVPDLGKTWLFISCKKCGYAWALWKLGFPRDWSPPE